jgi:hypothetical protein
LQGLNCAITRLRTDGASAKQRNDCVIVPTQRGTSVDVGPHETKSTITATD